MRSGQGNGSKQEKGDFIAVKEVGASQLVASIRRFSEEVTHSLVEITQIAEGEIKELALSLLHSTSDREYSEQELILLEGVREFPCDAQLAIFATEEKLSELSEGFARATLHASREFPTNSRAAQLAETQILSVYYDDVVITVPDLALLSGYREFPEEHDEYFAELVAKEIIGNITAEERLQLKIRRAGYLH